MTLHVDFDRDQWLYIPTEWPWEQFASRDQWRDAVTTAIGDAYDYPPTLRAWLGDTLTGLSSNLDPGEHRFGFLSRPHEILGFASLYERPGDRSIPLEAFSGEQDPAALATVEITEAGNPRLGPGRRTLRHVANPDNDNAVIAIAQWVWRTETSDVVMIASDYDVVRFGILLPFFDQLAATIAVIPDQEQ